MTPDRSFSAHFEDHVFGDPACETEFSSLGPDNYGSLFLANRFSDEVLKKRCYLIIGRRGSGKTALGKYFEFQTQIPTKYVIDIDEPSAFHQILRDHLSFDSLPREVSIPLLSRVWDYVFWSIVFHHLKDRDPAIAGACMVGDDDFATARIVRKSLMSLLRRVTDSDVASEVEKICTTEAFKIAKERAFVIARKEPVFLIFDTLENVSIREPAVMLASAALIQCAHNFNLNYGPKGVFVKVFVMAEAFPQLKEEVMLNPLKHVSDELYLHWRPKELLRLISRRLWVSLGGSGYLNGVLEPDWMDFSEVKKEIWDRFFGKDVQNRTGATEDSFAYILRHTQLRPRQLILMCNAIAAEGRRNNSFPYFTPHDIVEGVRMVESKLAEEVFNAYNEVYPHAGNIARALSGIPIIFDGSELDRRSRATAAEWQEGHYSQAAFIQLVVELGIVGTVRQHHREKGYIEAEFDYFREDQLTILPDSECVLHPMFYRKLDPHKAYAPRVFPFPDHPEFAEVSGR